jgi:hypothetical protein
LTARPNHLVHITKISLYSHQIRQNAWLAQSVERETLKYSRSNQLDYTASQGCGFDPHVGLSSFCVFALQGCEGGPRGSLRPAALFEGWAAPHRQPHDYEEVHYTTSKEFEKALSLYYCYLRSLRITVTSPTAHSPLQPSTAAYYLHLLKLYLI